MKAAVNHNLAGLPEEMEECMDDVFLDVWEHIERFDAAREVSETGLFPLRGSVGLIICADTAGHVWKRMYRITRAS